MSAKGRRRQENYWGEGCVCHELKLCGKDKPCWGGGIQVELGISEGESPVNLRGREFPRQRWRTGCSEEGLWLAYLKNSKKTYWAGMRKGREESNKQFGQKGTWSKMLGFTGVFYFTLCAIRSHGRIDFWVPCSVSLALILESLLPC